MGVDIQDKDEAARKFINDFRLTFPNAPDPGGKVSVDYGVYGVPETFFIDREGRIRAKHVGAVSDQMFADAIEPLLAASRRPRSELRSAGVARREAAASCWRRS